MANSEQDLNIYVYGVVFPAMLAIGIVGSLCNLVILNLLLHKTPACYIYMRGMSVCDLMMLIVTIPFAMRFSRGDDDDSPFSAYWVAWYFAHVDLYVGNAFAGAGGLLLLAMTVERYAAFCHPLAARSWQTSSARWQSRRRWTITSTIVAFAALVYAPFALQYTVVQLRSPQNVTFQMCSSEAGYVVLENRSLSTNNFYETYSVLKEFVLRIVPTVLLAFMNFRIVRKHRRASCQLRGGNSSSSSSSSCIVISQREQRRLQDGRRLAIVLGGLSIKFTVCTLPAAVLAITMDDGDADLDSYSYDLFRATANALEVLKNSTTFVVFYVCSADYRRQFTRCVLGCRSRRARTRHRNRLPTIVVDAVDDNSQCPSRLAASPPPPPPISILNTKALPLGIDHLSGLAIN